MKHFFAQLVKSHAWGYLSQMGANACQMCVLLLSYHNLKKRIEKKSLRCSGIALVEGWERKPPSWKAACRRLHTYKAAWRLTPCWTISPSIAVLHGVWPSTLLLLLCCIYTALQVSPFPCWQKYLYHLMITLKIKSETEAITQEQGLYSDSSLILYFWKQSRNICNHGLL